MGRLSANVCDQCKYLSDDKNKKNIILSDFLAELDRRAWTNTYQPRFREKTKIKNKKVWNISKTSKYPSKYRQNFCPAIGTPGVIFWVISYLRLSLIYCVYISFVTLQSRLICGDRTVSRYELLRTCKYIRGYSLEKGRKKCLRRVLKWFNL